MWVERIVRDEVIKAVASRPAVLLTGVRQSGKSSLLQRQFPDAKYISFDFLRYVEQAKDSPEYFLENLSGQTVLDEIQYVPELFRELKIFIDRNRENYGKWILTGSQVFELFTKISETLAGRIALIHLETLSASELRASGISGLEDYLWKGGYPEIWRNKLLDSRIFFDSYIRTYIERDLRSIIEINNLNSFQKLFRVLATRAGQLINYRNISKDIGVSDVTLKTWIGALQASGLIYLLPPYHANIGKRLTKTPKLYFADHGLLCHLLDIYSLNDWQSHTLKGSLWENFVFTELIKTTRFTPGRNLFFYRDQNGTEMDFVAEDKKILYLIEAKAAERVEKRKLAFDKIAPLFAERYNVENILAINIKEDNIIALKKYRYLNPLFTGFDIGNK